ncbi:calcium/sodium antiporter [Roseobacteraceae bacterium NS-SX3]
MFDIWLPLLGGLLFLILGGELLVRGAVQTAERLGIPPLVIGLTLVAFGTSAPELVTSVRAALAGAPGIAYGNIVGSNIANILLIGGTAALLAPVAVSTGALKRDGGVMLAAALVFVLLAAALPMTRWAGAGFVLALAVYVWRAIRSERAQSGHGHGAVYEKAAALEAVDPALAPAAAAEPPLVRALATAGAGLVLVVAGGGFLVDGAVALTRAFAVSETVIGLTIVAVGTSMPELATSVAAALRRQSDVAFGNIIGSNIYNILCIGGITAIAAPGEVPAQIVRFDGPLMVLVSAGFLAAAWTGQGISRREGSVLLAGYAAYIWWLWPA